MKGCFCTGGGVHFTLKKEFTPAGLILGYNPLYFRWTSTWPLLTWFEEKYYGKYKEYPLYEADHSFFTLQAYKAAVEKCYAITGTWPTKEQIGTVLTGIEVPSISAIEATRRTTECGVISFRGLPPIRIPSIS